MAPQSDYRVYQRYVADPHGARWSLIELWIETPDRAFSGILVTFTMRYPFQSQNAARGHVVMSCAVSEQQERRAGANGVLIGWLRRDSVTIANVRDWWPADPTQTVNGGTMEEMLGEILENLEKDGTFYRS